MSRTKYASFVRANEFERGFESKNPQSSKMPGWLNAFAVEQANKQKSAVEVARERSRPSIYNQMSSILNNSAPKFSSVDEIVEDYQSRTGLAEYLNKVQGKTASKFLSAIAKDIVAASEGLEAEGKKKILKT